MPRLAETLDAYGHLIMTEFNLIWPMLSQLLQPEGRRYIELSMAARGPVYLAEYVRLTAVHHSVQRDWAEFLGRYPLVVGPVYTEQPGVPGFDAVGAEEHARMGEAMRLCTATSFAGLPAVAVPTGVAGGLPQGVQVIAGPYREDLCLEAAAAIEARPRRLTPIEPRCR